MKHSILSDDEYSSSDCSSDEEDSVICSKCGKYFHNDGLSNYVCESDEFQCKKCVDLKILEECVAENVDLKESETNNVINKIIFPSDGMTEDNYMQIKNNLSEHKNIKRCEYCGKYYDNVDKYMIINLDEIVNSCVHCLMWLHFNDNRMEFDKKCFDKLGFSISDYILKCSDDHECDKCTHCNECFLCDYKNKIPITNILNEQKINASNIIKNNNYESHGDVIFENDVFVALKNKLYFKNNNDTQNR